MPPEDNLQPTTDNSQQNSELDPNVELKQIRTFQGDIAGALNTQKESLVSIQRAEQARRIDAQPQEESYWQKTTLLIIGTLVLLAMGSAGAWYAYMQFQEKTALPATTIVPNRFISVASTADISSQSRGALIQEVAVQRIEVMPANQIRHLQFRNAATSTLLTTDNFLKTMEAQAPGRLVRALDSNFMMGLVGGSTTSTFIIFKINSFENVFAGMLQWEPTLVTDLGPLFATAPNIGNILPETTFTDVQLRNKDVRLIRDQAGQTVLLYTYFDNKMLIITDNEETLRTLLSRLEAQALSR